MINIKNSWKGHLGPEAKKDYMKNLKTFLNSESKSGKTIFPQKKMYFEAFNSTPFEDVKVVILGQDPYHGDEQAHGLSFSVKPGVRTPPSLKNIYKELKADLGFEIPKHGHLQAWANQGVLLLNSVLTVEKGLAASHRKKGWEQFTDVAIEKLNQRKCPLVFILWGNYAQKKGTFIDSEKHLVLSSVHPSPLSASRGFFGNKHFSKCNDFLRSIGKQPINWKLEPLN